MKYIYIKFILIFGITLTSCEPEFENPIDDAGTYTNGEADFSTYIALGNSLTAGLADQALYITGQEASYPNLLSKQFSFAGGGAFKLPLMRDNIGGFSNDPDEFPPRLVLPFNNGVAVPPAVYTASNPTTDFTDGVGTVNNMGIPGAKVYHLVEAAAGYGNPTGVADGLANPYFVRFASDAGASVIGDAVAQQPTFFTLWIGNNDILSYATSGGTGVDQTGNIDVTTYGGNDITDPNVFAASYAELVTKLTNNNAKGVLLNLPDITSIPYFTSVPHNVIALDKSEDVAALNAAYEAYNLGLQAALAALAPSGLFTEEEVAKRTFSFNLGANPVVIFDKDLTDLGAINPAFAALSQIRPATEDDLLLITSSGVINTPVDPNDTSSPRIGIAVPLGDEYVLTPEEQTAIQNARTSYNTTITNLAASAELGLYDVASDLAQVATPEGLAYDGGVVTSVFATGGAFSLDGIHPTPRGQAIVTNGIIQTIERVYDAKLPRVDPSDFGTITLSNEVN